MLIVVVGIRVVFAVVVVCCSGCWCCSCVVVVLVHVVLFSSCGCFVVVFVFHLVVVPVGGGICCVVGAAGGPGLRAERRAETKSAGKGHLQGQASAVRAPRAQRLLVSIENFYVFFVLLLSR